ncbi:hypothetical protein MTO96_015842 [Rhipicephalus appendiculatus]
MPCQPLIFAIKEVVLSLQPNLRVRILVRTRSSLALAVHRALTRVHTTCSGGYTRRPASQPANAQCPSLVPRPSLWRPHKLSAERGGRVEKARETPPHAEKKKVPPKPLGDSRVTFRSDRRGPPRIQHLGATPAFLFRYLYAARCQMRVSFGARLEARVPFGAGVAGPSSFVWSPRGPRKERMAARKRPSFERSVQRRRKRREAPSTKRPVLAKFGAAFASDGTR